MKSRMKYGAKLLAMVLVLVTVLSVAAPALAANEQVYATTALNVRSGPGTNYPIVGELSRNQVVTRVGESGSWSIIELGNRRAYAHSAYLRPYGSGGGGGSTSGNTLYTTGRVNVRTGPGTGYQVLTTLKKGDAVSAIGTVGNWTIIKWNNGTAYMFTKYLTTSGSGGSGGSSGSLVPASGTMVATTNVNVRSGPGTNYSRLGWLDKGDTITRTGIIGNWTQVSYYGKTAYVHSSYLTPRQNDPVDDVRPASGTVEATIAVNVRSGPGTNYSVLGELRAGDRVVRTGTIGNWTRVEYRGRVAYVFTSYLRVVSGGGGGGSYNEKMYITAETSLRSGPNANAGRLTTIPAGSAVIYLGRDGTWARVEYGSYTGYVPYSQLSNDPVVSTSGVAYATSSTIVYVNSSTSSNRLGTLQAGEGVAVTGTVGAWLRVKFGNETGYIRSSEVVVLTSGSQTNFTAGERTMYSKANGLPVYTIPDDGSNTYRYGTMPLDEPVRRLAYNDIWTRIYADGRILYTRTENLKTFIGSVGEPQLNDQLKIINLNGAVMYNEPAMSTPFVIMDGNNNPAVDRVPTNAVVLYQNAAGNAYRVNWPTHGVTFYIAITDCELVTP